MAFDVVKKRIISKNPQIQIYTRGTIHFNIVAMNMMAGWRHVLLLFDKETRRLRMVRDVSLEDERGRHSRNVIKSGKTICIMAARLLRDFNVVEQHDVQCTDHGLNFIEFGPIRLKGDPDGSSDS